MILNGIERSDAEEWNEMEHDLEFPGEDKRALSEMYHTLNQDMWWLMVYKTTGDANKKVMSCAVGEGFEAYRKVSHWYYTISSDLIGDLRMRVMRPTPATKEDEI